MIEMPPILSLALGSLKARRFTALLTIISIATAVMLFGAVENIRQSARASFERTLTGTDLIVGARSSAINLTLYTIFQIGDPTNNVTWETYEDIRSRSDVAWTVPISLGDSHRGFRVIGTTHEYFDHYKYADTRDLTLRDGRVFEDLFEIVLGAQVARDLNYEVGTSLTLSHGLGAASFSEHSDKPFTVSGVLAPTGTPVDRSVFVSLPAIEAIHAGWRSGTPTPASRLATPERLRNANLQPKEITALLVGATSRARTLRIQRDLNTYRAEPLQAVIPGIALSQLWNMMSVVERALQIVSTFVIAVGLIGILTSILTSLNERRREMAILRSIGARPRHIITLLVSEAALFALIGSALGIAVLYGASWGLRPLLEERFNIGALSLTPGLFDLYIVSGITIIAALLGFIPAIIALKRSLSDGLTVRV
ncbi:MAG: FtsX-like permease family protein [Hyphomonadaceae bacterium]